MPNDSTPEPDDLAADELDTVAGGTGHGNVNEAQSGAMCVPISEACDRTIGEPGLTR